MANPATIDGLPAVLVAGTVEASVALHGDREYSIAHDGEDATGTADTNTVYLAVSASVVATSAEGADKMKLLAGRSVQLPPGITAIKFKAAAGAPTITVVPGKRLMGQF